MIEPADAVAQDAVLTPALCVVGGGAAGVALALQFVDAGLDVLLLEGGGLSADPANQALYEGEVADPALHSPTDQYRHRELGGSTATWGGRCVPFDPIDFEPRPWIAPAGWPIGFAEVARRYPDALRLLEAGDATFDAHDALEGATPAMIEGFAPRQFTTERIERFSCPTNVGRRYARQLADAPNLRVLTGANCTEIVTSADGARAERLLVRTLAGRAFAVAPRYCVIATGGLEAARLLLASRRRDPRGIGNAHDLVGRHYMCHIAGVTGQVRLRAPAHHGYARAWDGVYCRRRLALTADAQRALKIGNVVTRLHHPRLHDPAHGRGLLSAIYLAKPLVSYEYAKRLHGGGRLTPALALRHLWNVAREPFAVARFLADWTWRRTLAARKLPSLVVEPRAPLYSLDVHAEQAPNPDSRVTLGSTLDPFGMPRLRVDWRASPIDFETVRAALSALDADLRASGVGSLDFDADAIEADMLRDGAYGGHHIGTARMGASPQEGVVDADCRVFGLDNLFIAGSAVFPTSSQANPTLTIVALSLRLADHLKARIADDEAARILAQAAA